MMTTAPLHDVLAGQLADTDAGWSVGTFGAIAEFTRDPDEPADLHAADGQLSVVTDKGGLCLRAASDLRLIASESLTGESWGHRVALCLPGDASTMGCRTTLTEMGPDMHALRPQDRDGILFDLGLGTRQLDACIRVKDSEVASALRCRVGKPVFAPDNDVMQIVLAANPHRVFLSRLGRAEVFQPIPPPGGKSPDGPHTHVLPKLLAHNRTHAATEPIPDGWIPCAHLYPAHPLRDQLGRKHPFELSHHTVFQNLLESYGVPELVMLKTRVTEAVTGGSRPETVPLDKDRFVRATIRVALRQLAITHPRLPTLAEWLTAYDRLDSTDTDNPMEALH